MKPTLNVVGYLAEDFNDAGPYSIPDDVTSKVVPLIGYTHALYALTVKVMVGWLWCGKLSWALRAKVEVIRM